MPARTPSPPQSHRSRRVIPSIHLHSTRSHPRYRWACTDGLGVLSLRSQRPKQQLPEEGAVTWNGPPPPPPPPPRMLLAPLQSLVRCSRRLAALMDWDRIRSSISPITTCYPAFSSWELSTRAPNEATLGQDPEPSQRRRGDHSARASCTSSVVI